MDNAEFLRKKMKKKKKDAPVISGRARGLGEDAPNAGRDVEGMLRNSAVPPKKRKKVQ